MEKQKWKVSFIRLIERNYYNKNPLQTSNYKILMANITNFLRYFPLEIYYENYFETLIYQNIRKIFPHKFSIDGAIWFERIEWEFRNHQVQERYNVIWIRWNPNPFLGFHVIRN